MLSGFQLLWFMEKASTEFAGINSGLETVANILQSSMWLSPFKRRLVVLGIGHNLFCCALHRIAVSHILLFRNGANQIQA